MCWADAAAGGQTLQRRDGQHARPHYPCNTHRTPHTARSYVSDRKTGGASGSSGGGGPRARANVRTSSRAVPVDQAAKMTRDAIKREESLLLNAWSSVSFQGVGAGVAVLVLLAVLLAAGPPPADSRCTLPWC